jgi:hypothetical protein
VGGLACSCRLKEMGMKCDTGALSLSLNDNFTFLNAELNDKKLMK